MGTPGNGFGHWKSITQVLLFGIFPNSFTQWPQSFSQLSQTFGYAFEEIEKQSAIICVYILTASHGTTKPFYP